MWHSLFQVELVEDLDSALQDLVYVIHTVRVALHGQVDEGHLQRDYVLRGHVLARLRNRRNGTPYTFMPPKTLHSFKHFKTHLPMRVGLVKDIPTAGIWP